MWLWTQQPGKMYHYDAFKGAGYSGSGDGKNNPQFQDKFKVGPTPQGVYFIGQPYDSDAKGPFVLPLTPVPGTRTFGRLGPFLIHGDSKIHPGDASHGCIILPRPVREEIAASEDPLLVVLSGITLNA